MTSLTLGVLILMVSLQCAICGPVFLLATPTEIHYDSKLVVSVSAFGIDSESGMKTVTLEYRGVNDRSQVLNSTILEFTSDTTKEWPVVFSWEQMQKLDETSVQLTMSSDSLSISTVLVFSLNFGYMFIQTDKPVYTPRQTVKFRVIAVDEYQKLAKYIIRIDIKNHKGIVVDRMRFTAEEAFTAHEFELPKDTPPGIWTITSNFEGVDNTLSTTQLATFEVKEYVLPRFSSSVTVDTDVITKDTTWFAIIVTSRYIYGQPVLGSVNIRLGHWAYNSLTMMKANFTSQLINGQATINVEVNKVFPPNMIFAKDNRLFISATVTESASMETDEVVDSSTFISHPYYQEDFSLAKKYFKPGFPYTFQIRVAAQNGKPASWIKLYVLPLFLNENNDFIGGTGDYYELNAAGEMKQEFNVPPDTYRINFTVTVADLRRKEIERFSLVVNKFTSNNNQYLHINLTRPIKRNRDGNVLLTYTKPTPNTPSSKPQNITVLILAKGYIIFSTTTTRNMDGVSHVSLPHRLLAEISPSMRIVAYYLADTNGQEFIVDSLFVDTPDVCLEEISLGSTQSSVYKPKDIFKLDVDGSPNMNVGFVAVDKAVYLLKNKATVNREFLFGQLGSHDKGVGSADGRDMAQVFMNSGLQFLILQQKPGYADIPAHSEAIHEMGSRKSKQTGYVSFSEELPGITAAVSFATPPQSMRYYFPESWFFEERKLPKSGHMGINLTLPDSITTWSFMAVGVSPNRGICVSEPLEQQVMKLFFVDVRLPFKATRLEEVKVKISVYNYQHYNIEVDVIVIGGDGLCFSENSARGKTQNSTNFKLSIPAKEAKGITLKMIPLKVGDLILRVYVNNQKDNDIVEKKLYVVAEGLKVKKSITFVLDPESKHTTFVPSEKNVKALIRSRMINNTFDLEKNEQHTIIDLALPKDVIRGTESCRISAFGDLMGDIITHTVNESRTLIETPAMNAEEILGNLGPTIHALLSAQKFGLLNENLSLKGKKFVKREAARLLKYIMDNFSYSLSQKQKSSIWLTAFALKTLCHAQSIDSIDRKLQIDKGFYWLYKQLAPDGGFSEQERRTRSVSPSENNLLLSAEVLIAVMECGSPTTNSPQELKYKLSIFLKSQIWQIYNPLVLAKVTYALMLVNDASDEYHEAVKKLQSMKRKTAHGK